MSVIVFDTDLLTLYEQGNANVLKNVVLHLTDTIAISVISIEEQLAGWQSILNKTKQDSKREQVYLRMAQTVESLAGWPILPYTIAAMQRRTSFLRSRLNVGSNDLKIAAIALEFNAVVVTRNIRDFSRIPGVSWADWST